MAESYYPFDAGAGANAVESQWRAMAQMWVTGGSGVLAGELNTLETFGDSTGLQVKVKSGRAWVRGHYYENDAQRTLSISSNSSGNPRIDRVVARLDATANTITALVITGTPAASPSAPAITQTSTTWDIPLAQVAVANGAATISAGNVTDERAYVGPLLPAVRVPSSTVRDLIITAPYAGALVDRGGRLEQYDGSAWQRMSWSTSSGRTGFKLRKAAAQSIASGVTTDISFDTEDLDSDGFISAPSATVTIPTGLGGLYIVSAQFIGPTNWVTNANYFGAVIAAGITCVLPGNAGSGGQTDRNALAAFLFQFAAGDTVTLRMAQTSGSSQNFTASLTGYRIGP